MMKRKLSVAAMLLLGGVALAGCSSPSAPAAESSGTTTPSSDSVAAASAEWIAPYMERPTSIGIDAPIEKGIPEAKNVYYMQCSVPSCQEMADTIRESMDVVGWKLTTVDAGTMPEEMKTALAQAINDKPDAVVVSGIHHTVFTEEMSQLKELGIPVVNITTADPPTEDMLAVFFEVPEFEITGERLAHYAMSQSGEQTNAVSFMISAYSNTEIVANTFTETITDNCDQCSADIVDIPVTALGSSMVQQVVAYLQSHPDVNWINLGFADMIVGLPDAMRAAGISEDVKIVSIAPSDVAFEALRNGDYLVALDSPSTYDMTWRITDVLIRHFNGEPVEPSIAHTYPEWVVTKDNLPVESGTFPLVENYKEQFTKLWGK